MTKDDRGRTAVDRTCLVIGPGGAREESLAMIGEASVEILLNGEAFSHTRCMAIDLVELAVGHLVASGMLESPGEVVGVEVSDGGSRVDVSAEIPAARRALDRYEGRAVDSSLRMDADTVIRLGCAFNERPGLYAATRCVHSAAVSDGSDIVHLFEDVGRHNAMDKAIGSAFLAGRSLSGLLMLSSGRLPADMVSKLAGARIPIVVSPAAATVEGADLAMASGITVCGRVRRDGMIVYSRPERISIA